MSSPASPISTNRSNVPSRFYSTEATSVPSAPPYTLSAAHARLWYYGISKNPPTLVYTTSAVPFVAPTGPEAYPPSKRLDPVYGHAICEKWEEVCDATEKLLDEQQLHWSSLDLVRFRTLRDEQHAASVSPPTFWIGVFPGQVTGAQAAVAAEGIREILLVNAVEGIDIEFRESMVERAVSTQPLLEHPADEDAVRRVANPLTMALGIPVAGYDTPDLQGTMGPLFTWHSELYAITARHVLLGTNETATFTAHSHAPERKVVVMGHRRWERFVGTIELAVVMEHQAAEIHRKSIKRYEDLAQILEEGTSRAFTNADRLPTAKQALATSERAIDAHGRLLKWALEHFSTLDDRVIGKLHWAPKIDVNVPPKGFTRDICVVKLVKKRFEDFPGNGITLHGKHTLPFFSVALTQPSFSLYQRRKVTRHLQSSHKRCTLITLRHRVSSGP